MAGGDPRDASAGREPVLSPAIPQLPSGNLETSSCYVRVRHIRALFDELKARGAPFRYELTHQPWGMLEMQVDDPYGNALRFGEAEPAEG